LLTSSIQSEGRVTKNDLIDRVKQGHAEWEALIAEVDESGMTEPGVMSDWSVKDIVAHVAWYEWWTGEFVRTKNWPVLAPHLDSEDTDTRNNAYYHEMKDAPLDGVMELARRSFDELIAAIEPLSEEEFATPALLGMPDDPGWALGAWLPENTYRHYEEHAAAIRAWLDSNP
jgi:hypothetical protein